jgi:hypothetical protein
MPPLRASVDVITVPCWVGRPMPDILIRCPVMGEPVPTGLDTETVIFESLPSIALPVECPSCGRAHHWRPTDAWVKDRPLLLRRAK